MAEALSFHLSTLACLCVTKVSFELNLLDRAYGQFLIKNELMMLSIERRL